MARRTTARSSTPRAEQSQSNTVLIVFVVISMLANVGLGIMWYLSQDEIVNAKKAQEQANSAAAQAAASKKLLEDFYLVRLRQMLDDTVGETERSAMTSQASKAMQSPLDWLPALLRKMEGDGTPQNPGLLGPYDNASGKLANNVATRLKVLDDQISDLRKKLKGREDELAKLTAEYAEYKKAWNEAQLAAKLKEAGNRADADTREKLNQKDIVIKDQLSKIAATEKQLAQALEDAKNTATAEKKKLEERAEALVNQRDLEIADLRKLLLSRNYVQLDKPRGQIVKADPTGEVVYINLGTAHRLTTGTTFSVHAVGAGGKALPDPKARIEVINVLGPNVAQARVKQLAKPEHARQNLTSSDDAYWITDTREFWRARNPLVPGDQLFNPAWEANRDVHIALAGYFDIDGDGQDDLPAFMRLLKNHGVEVDCYLDPADNFKQHGRLSNNTEFLVIGGATSGKANEISALQAEAAKKGIEVVSLGRFMDRMGFTADRMPVAKNGKTPTAPAAAPPASPKPEEPKKEGDAEKKEEGKQ